MKMKSGLKVISMLFLLALPPGGELRKGSPSSVGKANRNGIISKKPLAANPEVVPERDGLIMGMIAEREYHISPDAKGRLQSPNREQDLRAYYEPGVLGIQSRRDASGNSFKLKLINNGIYADGKKLYSPRNDASADGSANKLIFDHNGFKEEFVNSSEGVRQNFIVDQVPGDASHLAVHLKAEGLTVEDLGNNQLRLYAQNDGVKQQQLIYEDIHCWDANGKVLESSLSYVKNEVVLDVDVRHAAYPVTIDPIIKNGNPTNAAATIESGQDNAGIGCSVTSAGDINGDGYSDIVAGAYAFDNGQTNEGAAFVFYGSSTGISTTAATILEGGQPDANFGFSVGGAGDVNQDGFSDVIVGAPKYSHGESEEGVAFIYYGSASGLSPSSATLIERNQPSANLGYSVSTGGDINGDGFSDVLIGAPFYDLGESNEGVVFEHLGSAAGVTNLTFEFTQSNKVDALLGFSVACAGDVNGDGFSDMVVGSIGYKNAMASNTTGAALVFHGSAAAGLIYSVTLWANTSANMGFSVAGAGDVNGDGYSDVVVGANKFREDDGAAFVFHGSSLGVNASAAATLTLVDADAGVGNSVACAGDVNGDNFSDVIVGASNYTNGQSKEGAALVFHGSLPGVKTEAASVIESNQANANMGFAVASAGDVNGDGYSDVVTGAYTYDNGNVDEGAAFVFHGSASSSSTTFKITKEMNQADASFGYSVSSAGDVNGDGFSDVIVGAPFFDQGEENEGAAFVFHGSISGLLFPGGSIEGNQKDANMGYSVSCAGDMNGDGYSDVIIGAVGYDNGEAKEGAAFVLKGSSNGVSFGWWQLTLDADQADAAYGNSVAGAGDVNGDGYSDVIVGALLYDNDQVDEGVAFVYHGSEQGVSLVPEKMIEADQSLGVMGYAVNGAGDINGDGFSDIVVSAVLYTKTQTEEGMISVYYGSKNGLIYDSPQTFFGEQLGAGLGSSVSSAGDVNGDGFGDVVIGAYRYFNGELQEGAALVYQGTATGLDLASVRILDSNQSDSWMGSASASAGDVNGDGYSDVIVGARNYDLGAGQEGAVFIYHGSGSGIVSLAAGSMHVSQVGAGFGLSVSSAGDINGDGYSDVIVGADHYTNVQNNEGGAFVYLGNEGSAAGTRNNLALYNSDLATLIEHSSISKNDFGIGLQEKSFLGRTKGKLVWESRKEGEGFSNVPITNSTQSTAQQVAYTDLGIFTLELKDVVAKLGKATKVRARTRFDPVTAITGQMYSPWRYVSAFSAGWSLNESTPLPVTLTSFSAKRVEEHAFIEWSTSEEINSKSFEIHRSADGKSWEALGEVAAQGTGHGTRYDFNDLRPLAGENLYRLKMIDHDGTFAYSQIQAVAFDDLSRSLISIYPNPASKKIRLQGDTGVISSLRLLNSLGQIVMEIQNFTEEINVEKLPTGIYILLTEYKDGTQESRKVAVHHDL